MHRRGINILPRGPQHTAARAQLSNGDFKPRQRKFVPPAPPRLPDDSGAVNKKPLQHCEGLFFSRWHSIEASSFVGSGFSCCLATCDILYWCTLICFRMFFMAIHMFDQKIVSALQVDKLPNLAGLCRTCEVFHCEALCLPNLKARSFGFACCRCMP